jgi:hypothetical protein
MRKVFGSLSDVIHVYAQRSQSEGSAASVFFYGDKIYSYGYHYLMGQFIDENTIVIDDRSPSVTTSKHVRYLISATSQYKQFYKSDIDLQTVYTTIQNLSDKIANARDKSKYVVAINNKFERLTEWIDYSKSKELKKTDVYKKIKKIVDSIKKENFEKFVEKQKEAEKKRKLAEKNRVEKMLQDFLNYKINSFRLGRTDYLRLSADEKYVETNQSVRIEVEHAKILYLKIKNNEPVRGHRIGNYVVNSLDNELTIGCHNINMKSVKEIGEKILKLSV